MLAEIGEQVHSTWERAIGVDVDSDTDFFLAGGDSLMAMRIIGELSAALGVKVPLRMLFDNPRCEDFVRTLEGLVRGGEGVPL
jgi:yersiniabactin nonribosomal peptide/polyketide synthase